MKRIFFLLSLGLMGLIGSKGEAMRLDPDSHAVLSDPEYAKHIEVKCYLVTREQLAKVFANERATVVQKTNKDLYKKNVFILVRCKNLGNHVAFGTLNCFSPNSNSPTSFEVTRMWAGQTDFYDYAIYLGSPIIFPNDELPKIKYEWDCLYTM